MALHLQESSHLSSPPATTGHCKVTVDDCTHLLMNLSLPLLLSTSLWTTQQPVIPLSKPSEVCLLPEHHPISDILKMHGLVLSPLLRRSELSCHHSMSHPFRPSYSVLFAVYQTSQIQLCLRAFACIILSAWNALLSGIHRPNLSLTSERPSN